MKKLIIIITILLTVTFLFPAAASAEPEAFEVLKDGSTGSNVILIQMRLRELGYVAYRATGLYGTLTRNGVIGFQEQNGLGIDGTVGPETFSKLFETGLERAPLAPDMEIVSGPPMEGTPSQYGTADDWFTTVSSVFYTGATAKITDLNSGITFEMKRTGGENHAEVESPDNTDYQSYLRAFGGEPNWEKRAVLVTIGGHTFAASLFGMPHGGDAIANNGMAGHTCLYFTGSYSHVYGLPDVEHEKMVKVAAGLR